jgi:hypothetical protein
MAVGGGTMAVAPVNGSLVKLLSSWENKRAYSPELNGRHK